MAYSRNPDTLESRIHLVDFLGDMEPKCEWSCEPGDEYRLAYQIREALWIAANVCPQRYPRLRQAQQHYQFKVTPGRVVATLRDKPRGTVTATPTPTLTPAQPSDEEIDRQYQELEEQAGNPITMKGTLTLTQIIQVIKDNGITGLPYKFPEASLAVADVRTLCRWLASQGQYLLFWGHPAITIKAYTEELAPYATIEEEIE